MNNLVQQQQAVSDAQTTTLRRIRVLEGERQLVQDRLSEFDRASEEHRLLAEISERLSRLEEVGAGELFWADQYRDDASEVVLRRIARTLKAHNADRGLMQEKAQKLDREIASYEETLADLDYEAERLQQEQEEAQFEFEVTRELDLSRDCDAVMPWHKQGEDEKRFRKSVLASLLLALLLGSGVALWTLPEPDENQVIEIPERLAKLVIEKKTKPKPPPEPKQAQQKPDEKKPEPKKEVAQKEPPPTKAEKKEARRKAERAGVLAFKDNFQDLIEDDLDQRLGVQTQLSTTGKRENRSQRSLITAAAKAGSGGIDTASLSRNVGGTGSALNGVAFSRVESSIGSEGDFAGEDRPLSNGAGPSRTDEEIQIVFDRYKAALYRIYNRELRKNPALQGKMVLRITIEPDGSVSLAKVETSDMDSATLDRMIASRVKRFNFGPKAGVPTITILYPIDFLPAG
ncbi:AgmX/PglI C-terminal domain-containing protein [Biformimicrobium ophioploci]|uniref:Uncharacterized protein n=1 Tax=Biformimicrobium ophioploci TaxID=3036711 RepID=A0ABQ6LWC2_9GAMM|nr:AgmX/PglI C-terminal domain-containing protein [Microbulbifer sp. NKW57]GMG86399.1 hypothetical protein MNKW57_07200 [Microbulbifer sp. NKW57]